MVYGVLFLVPLVLQVGGSSARDAGIALVPAAGVFFFLSNVSGPIAERIGTRDMISGGTALIGIGLLIIACTDAGRPLMLVESGLVLTGCGMGLNTGPLFSVAVAKVSAARSGSASSLVNVARMVGATLGVAVLGSTYAMAGPAGLSVAMLVGGIIQIAGASVARGALQ
jgi:predicted MFS family arabinose efflux permease